MLFCSWSRNVITPVGYIGNLTKRRVQASPSIITSCLRGVWGSTHSLYQELRYRTSIKMMVDTGSTESRAPVVCILPEKEDNGGFISGAFKSNDGKLNCGYSSFRGKRTSMEDFYDVKMSKIDGKMVCMFGIFDGHGGSRAAEYLKKHLFENLMKHPRFMQDTRSAICETYKQTDVDFLDTERDSYRDDGSTASTAVLIGNHLYVANVGDSRTIISKAGKAIPLSEDHKPNRTDERKRIENAGGVIMWAGTWRVGGVLAMSRAFGNRMLKQYVVAEPEIQEQEITEELELLVLASDGLWDVVPNEDAVFIAQTEEEPEAAARKLTDTAFARGSADNITCIVVRINHENVIPAKASEKIREGSGRDVHEPRGHEIQDGSSDTVHEQGTRDISDCGMHDHSSRDGFVGSRSGGSVDEQRSQDGSGTSVQEPITGQEGSGHGVIVQKVEDRVDVKVGAD